MELEYGMLPETFKPRLCSGGAASPSEGAQDGIFLISARRDTAAAVIAISPRDEDILLSVAAEPAFSSRRDAEGAMLREIRLAAYGSIKLKLRHILFHPDGESSAAGDALDTEPLLAVDRGHTGYIYAEADIPERTEPGEYEICIALYEARGFAAERRIGVLSIRLRVYGLIMPEKRGFSFFLDLWQHPCAIARAHRVEPWSEEHFSILEGYVAALSALGQKSAGVIVSCCPWGGQFCHKELRNPANLYEYQIIKITLHQNGGFSYDYSIMQRYIDLCAKYGIAEEISVFGLVNVWCNASDGFEKLARDHPDGARLRYYSEKDGSYGYISSGYELDRYAAALEEYFARTGQLDRVRIVADEPADLAAYRASVKRLHMAAPRFRIKAAINHAEFIRSFGAEADDFAPSLECLCRESAAILDYKSTAGGKRLLWYVCNEPAYPNTFLSSDGCEALAIGLITAFFGLDGFLRWSFGLWCADPIRDNRYLGWPTGDLCLVYPAPSGGVMLSLRYKLLKRGIELAELCRMYREKYGGAALKSLLLPAVKEQEPGAWFEPKARPSGKLKWLPIEKEKLISTDYTDYHLIREKLLKALSP